MKTQELPMKRNGHNTHMASEFLVAGELWRRGYNVAWTMGNAKAVDLAVMVDNGKSVSIQVKGMWDRKSIGWTMFERDVKPHVIYVFVCLNPTPEYFICTPDEARDRTALGSPVIEHRERVPF